MDKNKFKYIFIAWALFVLGSYLYFIFQKGLSKWPSLRF